MVSNQHTFPPRLVVHLFVLAVVHPQQASQQRPNNLTISLLLANETTIKAGHVPFVFFFSSQLHPPIVLYSLSLSISLSLPPMVPNVSTHSS